MLKAFVSPRIAAAVVLAAGGVASASSVDIGFTRITNNGNGVNPASQFVCTIADVIGQSNQVTFTFKNNVGIASNIAEIYFDDRNPLQLLSLNATLVQIGCSFTGGGASPGNLPGGATLSPAFNAIQSFSADVNPGPPSNGLNVAGDSLTMQFTLQPGRDYNSVVSAISQGTLRLGLHVRSIGTVGGSDSFVNGGQIQVVPLPMGAWAGLGGLLMAAGIRATRRR